MTNAPCTEGYICPQCGLTWIMDGDPSEEGTQKVKQRCYCELDGYSPLILVDKLIKETEK